MLLVRQKASIFRPYRLNFDNIYILKTWPNIFSVMGTGAEAFLGKNQSFFPFHIRKLEGNLENGSIIGFEGTFENSWDTEKDLEKVGFKIEGVEIEKFEDNLINYGFSSERARYLGKLLFSYKKIKNKRELTIRERDLFTKEVLEITFKKASEILENDGYDVLINKASEVNGVGPEAVREVLNDVL